MDVVSVVNDFGFPIVAAVGMLYMIYRKNILYTVLQIGLAKPSHGLMTILIFSKS